MLSKAKMVVVRKAIEQTYIGVCTIVEKQKVLKQNKSTGFEEVIVLQNEPCKLSFSSIKSANKFDNATGVGQIVKLFIAPEVNIKTGSKIIVNQNGVTNEYKNSGVPAIYISHQEIILELFKEWS